MHKRLLTVVIAAAFIISPAYAAVWRVDREKSQLTFEGTHAGELFKGSFQKFDTDIEFNERNPAQSKVRVTIDMASVVVEGKDRQESLPGAEWFNIKQFPTATFTSTNITDASTDKSGAMMYSAAGILTIRGIERPVSLLTALRHEGDRIVKLSGFVELNRMDFNVGTGEWKTDQYVKFPVKVQFTLYLNKE